MVSLWSNCSQKVLYKHKSSWIPAYWVPVYSIQGFGLGEKNQKSHSFHDRQEFEVLV